MGAMFPLTIVVVKKKRTVGMLIRWMTGDVKMSDIRQSKLLITAKVGDGVTLPVAAAVTASLPTGMMLTKGNQCLARNDVTFHLTVGVGKKKHTDAMTIRSATMKTIAAAVTSRRRFLSQRVASVGMGQHLIRGEGVMRVAHLHQVTTVPPTMTNDATGNASKVFMLSPYNS